MKIHFRFCYEYNNYLLSNSKTGVLTSCRLYEIEVIHIRIGLYIFS